MGYKNRELEIKFLVNLENVNAVFNILKTLYKKEGISEVITGNATDLYWNAPEGSSVDFVRLRQKTSMSEEGEITVKATDKTSITDLIEIDVAVKDVNQAKALLTAVYGAPQAEVTKRYKVLFLEDTHTNVSVYRVKEDKRVFVEVEATNPTRLKELVDIITPCLKLSVVKTSVYQMFVVKSPMKLDTIDNLHW
jgi:adenylate cyclase class IV